MPPSRQTHTVDPVYAPPVLRAASPTDTITTDYGEDETSPADRDMTEEEFAQRVEAEIGLRRTNWSDAPGPKSVLLPRPSNKQEEAELFEKVMESLRREVAKLEEEDLFDTVARKNIGPAFAKEPSARDIDAIMQRMILSESASEECHDPEQVQMSIADQGLPADNQYGGIGRGFPAQRR